MQKLTVSKGINVHGHFRQSEKLAFIVPWTAREFQIGQAMPNTEPPILTGEQAIQYRREILGVARRAGHPDFGLISTIKITPKTTPKIIRGARQKGVLAGKLYFKNTTTMSEDGVDPDKFWELDPVFEAMQETGMHFCGHWEVESLHGKKVKRYGRERAAIDLLCRLADHYRQLKITVEHASTKIMCSTVERLPENVGASLTVHHLWSTVHDMIDTRLHPDFMCQPLLQEIEDRDALVEKAISGNAKFFYGGDDALHLSRAKYCADCCSGIFNAPVAVPLLITLFEKHNALNKLDDFLRKNAMRFYEIAPKVQETATYCKEPWVVPQHYEVPGTNDFVVPFFAGKTIPWKLAG